ncbi:HAD hydrolase-like protein [Lachnospira multipara]|uniref:HAD hydrolase-like protein n=1 Tax=Lachnospira multipara TaxID=28051 RepID=UPI000481AFF9|nr:HAD hydrolase-like protein [Lachnospira multipara]
MYNYVFFDLDGTLTQSEFGILQAIEYSLGQLGEKEISKETKLKFIGPPLYDSFVNILGYDDEKATKGVKIFREYYESTTLFNAPLYDGIKEVLSKLVEEGKTLYVITSKVEAMAEKIVNHFEIDKFFKGIVGSDPNAKTHGKDELIRKVLEMENIEDLSSCVMIGDTKFDINAANKVGIKSIGAGYGYGSVEELKALGSTHIVSKPVEILEYV